MEEAILFMQMETSMMVSGAKTSHMDTENTIPRTALVMRDSGPMTSRTVKVLKLSKMVLFMKENSKMV